MLKKALFVLGLVFILFGIAFGGLKFWDIFHSETTAPQETAQTKTLEEKPQNTPTEATFDKAQHPLDQAGSIWWVVNKTRPISPSSYKPSDLAFPTVTLRVPGNETMKISASISDEIERMFADAKTAGHNLMFSSGFRSYSYQTTLYNSYVAKDGKAAADTYSARPGYSEHQTGLAFDVCLASDCELEEAFGTTNAGQWVADNAHTYGFIIRYPEGKTPVTGYQYEPWHLRYVGVELATEMNKTGIQTLEEFFGLPAAPDYQ